MFGISTHNWNHPSKWKGTKTGRAYGAVASYGMSEAALAGIDKMKGKDYHLPDVAGTLGEIGGYFGMGNPGQMGPNPNDFKMGSSATDKYGAIGAGYADRQVDPATEAMLMAQANGTAPSAAQLQMQESLRRNQAMAMGLAGSNANVSPALAQRQAMQAQAQMGMQTAQQTAQMRAQEQAHGQEMLANYQLNQQNQNDQMIRYFQSLGYSIDEAQLKAKMALSGAQMQSAGATADRNTQLLGTALSVGGTVLGGMYGGPMGAAAGGAAGKMVAGGLSGGGGGASYVQNPAVDSSGGFTGEV